MFFTSAPIDPDAASLDSTDAGIASPPPAQQPVSPAAPFTSLLQQMARYFSFAPSASPVASNASSSPASSGTQSLALVSQSLTNSNVVPQNSDDSGNDSAAASSFTLLRDTPSSPSMNLPDSNLNFAGLAGTNPGASPPWLASLLGLNSWGADPLDGGQNALSATYNSLFGNLLDDPFSMAAWQDPAALYGDDGASSAPADSASTDDGTNPLAQPPLNFASLSGLPDWAQQALPGTGFGSPGTPDNTDTNSTSPSDSPATT